MLLRLLEDSTGASSYEGLRSELTTTITLTLGFMKILVFSKSFYPAIGGVETICQILATCFTRDGHSVCVVTDSVCKNADASEYQFKVVRRPSHFKVLHLWHWCDIVLQINLEARKLWPLLISQKPIVIGLQTWIHSAKGNKRFIHRVKRSLLKNASAVIACSESIRERCWPPATVIFNPYQSSTFKCLPDIKREKRIVFLGRLVSDKGADLLINAFSSLKPSGWELSIIGSGPELATLSDLVNDLKLQGIVRFMGSLRGPDLAKVLNEHEIMVVPSRWNEPFGIVALEGIACGCAVLASNGGGLPRAVGKAGMLFTNGDLHDLTDKLSLLIKSSRVRESCRQKAPDHLVNFSESAIADKYLSIFTSILKS